MTVGSRVLWRVTVPPGVTQVVAQPTGEVINLNGGLGFWYESTPGTVVTFEARDVINPSVSITAPGDNTVGNTFPSVSGTADDNAGTDSIARVDLTVQRVAGGQFWNGTGWAPAATPSRPPSPSTAGPARTTCPQSVN